ncbi:MAG: PDZ domain-containing protein [Vicinamibacteria bacterium]|nr:PDZ domain-containing protein [Vicinamibacteria bacterium]
MSARGHLIVALISALLAAYVSLGWLGMVLGDSAYTQLALFNEVLHIVLNAYVEPVDMERTMNGAQLGLTEALDGDSSFLSDADLAALKQPSEEGEIGAVLTRRFGFLMVVAARADSPADRAGLRSGDIIKTIDGKHTHAVSVPIGESMLRGSPGSLVKLAVFRSGTDPLNFAIVREKIARAVPTSRMCEQSVGYLKIPELTAGTDDLAVVEITALKRDGANKLVLDLRGAAHGKPQEAAKIAALFMEGAVARLSGRTAGEEVLATGAIRPEWRLPLTVLIDAGTAGAGEILAAALLDSGRAKLVGRRTFGRAAAQKTIPLERGALRLTVAHYLRLNGKPIHGEGIEPSVPVDSPQGDESETESSGDPILEKGIEVLLESVREAAA